MLFFAGASLAYYVLFPYAFAFFASFQSNVGGGRVPIELLDTKVLTWLTVTLSLTTWMHSGPNPSHELGNPHGDCSR